MPRENREEEKAYLMHILDRLFVVLFFYPFCDVTLLKPILWFGSFWFSIFLNEIVTKLEMEILILRLKKFRCESASFLTFISSEKRLLCM